jgi:hypothetical protein
LLINALQVAQLSQSSSLKDGEEEVF